jgi:phage terminase large subunit
MSKDLANKMAAFQQRYFNDPNLFVREVLGQTPDDWQADVLDMIAGTGKYEKQVRRISIRSGHGVGKSCLASWALIWHQIFRFPQKSIVTAPSHSQLHDALGSEIRSWITALPAVIKDQLEVLSEQIRMKAAPNESFISFRVSRPEASETLAGVHSANVLLVCDESSGIAPVIFESAASSMSGENATTLLLGNPVRGQGFFYDTHNKLSKDWETRKVSCLDSKRVSKEFINEISSRYSESSNQYRVRVLGEFPLADEDAIIPRHLVESSVGRDVEPIGGEVTIGVDVARFGSDSSAICLRQGNHLLGDGVSCKRGLDTMQVVGWVRSEIDLLKKKKIEVGEIMVDSIGLGAGVVDRLLEEGIPCRGINVSEAPSIKGGHLNLRSELWEKARSWFEGRDVVIPNDERLIMELCSVRYGFSSTGKTKVESKDDIRRRLGSNASPDAADAFCLTFAGYAAHGKRTSWNKPLVREIKGIV